MDTKHHQKLSSQERDLIAVWKAEGLSLRKIAGRLKRSVSTVSDEIKRNNFRGYYVSIHAQGLAETRKREGGRRYPLKDTKSYGYVLEKLKEGWSPEQISGRLKTESGKRVICPETIYGFIYREENLEKRLWEYLPWKRKRRHKKNGRKTQRIKIPNRISIHLRPDFVNHQGLNKLGIKIYFADPYSSWQRGTNEQTNGLIRRYLPKKMSFNSLTQEELNDIVWEINNRPRKCLNYSTPQEAYSRELKQLQINRSVAIPG